VRKRISRSAESTIVFAARSRAMLRSTFLVSTSTLGYAAALSLLALSASSPALAQFVCTTTAGGDQLHQFWDDRSFLSK
jgi:hypothetical protein